MPNFPKGFDEADRKDVRMVSVQESGRPVSLCLSVPADKDNRAAKVSRDGAGFMRYTEARYSAPEHSRLNSPPAPSSSHLSAAPLDLRATDRPAAGFCNRKHV